MCQTQDLSFFRFEKMCETREIWAHGEDVIIMGRGKNFDLYKAYIPNVGPLWLLLDSELSAYLWSKSTA